MCYDRDKVAKAKSIDASRTEIIDGSQTISTKTKIWRGVNTESKSFKLGANEYQTEDVWEGLHSDTNVIKR